ncbi:MAG TPA: Hpt domain-containing protein, partial [Cellvibrionaceae bacterium]|nr:Hpt domain-containing protein [Cellvibrionaceae bacterium]
MTTSQPTAEQQELIGLLHSELSDLASYDLSPLHSGDEEAKNALLDELFSHLDNLGHAARLVGLLGVERVCEHLKANFLIWQHQPWVDENSILMAGWCPLLIHYLTSIGSEQENTAVSQLVEYVLDNRWPQGEHYEALQQAFSSSEIIADEDSPISQLPSFVDEDMVSLAIDSDVNRDLLNGLLQELPEHSASFSRAVARLVEEQDTAALAIALRAAHTVKGAANLVGIRGLANLMHYTEDLLELIVKQSGAVAQASVDLLEDTADALASISEYLIGLGPKPAQLIELLSRVLTQLRQAYSGQWEYSSQALIPSV